MEFKDILVHVDSTAASTTRVWTSLASDLLAEPVPGIEKRCPDLDKIPHARDKGSNPFFESDLANGSDLEPEIAQVLSDVILDSDSLRLQ
jgi:hypothetical protein